MIAQAAWLLAILAVIIAAAIGFFVGRRFSAGKERIEELEAELKRQQAQSDDYRNEVATHFDKTATLFVSMAGSYKELFEHLSTGYEKLSAGSAREILHQRVDALLVGDSRGTVDDDKSSTGASVAAAAAAVGAAGPIGAVDTADTAYSAVKTVAAPDEATGATADTPTAASEAFTHIAPESEELRVEPFASVPNDVAAETAPASDAPAEPLTADEPIAVEPVAAEPGAAEPGAVEPVAAGPRRDEAALVGDLLAEGVFGDRATPSRDGSR